MPRNGLARGDARGAFLSMGLGMTGMCMGRGLSREGFLRDGENQCSPCCKGKFRLIRLRLRDWDELSILSSFIFCLH